MKTEEEIKKQRKNKTLMINSARETNCEDLEKKVYNGVAICIQWLDLRFKVLAEYQRFRHIVWSSPIIFNIKVS